jgi:dTDP-4-dehydrorhamnose reductase
MMPSLEPFGENRQRPAPRESLAAPRPVASPPAEAAPPLPLLVTGVAGVAGYNAFHHFRHRFPGQVIGLRRKDNWPLCGEGIVACDGDDRDTLRRLFDRYQFAAVLNAEGTCKLKSCELDPAMARRVNIDSVTTLLDVLAGSNTRLVHLSIDLVYSGTRGGGHLETDPPDPVTVYGRTMAEAEQILLQALPPQPPVPPDHCPLPAPSPHGDATDPASPLEPTRPTRTNGSESPRNPRASRPTLAILRISLPMGISFNGHAGAIDWIQHRFRHGRPATLYFDEIRTPAYADCLNRLFAAVLARPDIQGLFHAGGPRRLSLYQIAQIVSRVGGYDPRLLHGCLRKEAGPIPPRAGDVSMDSSKLTRVLGYAPLDPWPLEEAWVPTHRDWHYEGPRGCPALLRHILYRNPRLARPDDGLSRLGRASRALRSGRLADAAG